MPQYVGKKADGIYSDQNFVIEIEGVYSEEVDEGLVISQYPEENARRVARGEPITVTLTVSLGAQKGALPDLSGFDVSEAASQLRALGALSRVVYIYTDEVEDGRVIESAPKPQSEIKRGQTVTLYIAKAAQHSSVKVRDLVGMTLEDAAFLAMSDGLCVGEVEYLSDGNGGVVIEQSLAPDILVKHGTYINLTVGADESGENENSGEELGFFDRIREFFKKK